MHVGWGTEMYVSSPAGIDLGIIALKPRVIVRAFRFKHEHFILANRGDYGSVA